MEKDDREIERLIERFSLMKWPPTDDPPAYLNFPLDSEVCEALSTLLTHFHSKQISIEQFLMVKSIRDYVASFKLGQPTSKDDRLLQLASNLTELCDGILARPDWPSRIKAVLKEEDDSTFWRARDAAVYLDIDTWEQTFRMIEKGRNGGWLFERTINDLQQAEKLFQYAEEMLLSKSPLLDLGLIFRCLENFTDLRLRLVKLCFVDSRSEVRYLALTTLRERPRLGLVGLDKQLVDALTNMKDNDPDFKTKVFAGNVLKYHLDGGA